MYFAEYVEGGTLSETLLNHSIELSWVMRSKFAKDIASGMVGTLISFFDYHS